MARREPGEHFHKEGRPHSTLDGGSARSVEWAPRAASCACTRPATAFDCHESVYGMSIRREVEIFGPTHTLACLLNAASHDVGNFNVTFPAASLPARGQSVSYVTQSVGGEERELLDDREAVLPDRRRPSGEMCNVTGGSSPAGGPEPGAAETSGRAVLEDPWPCESGLGTSRFTAARSGSRCRSPRRWSGSRRRSPGRRRRA